MAKRRRFGRQDEFRCSRFLAGVALCVVTGCAGGALPDPRATLVKYEEALRRGDTNAIYELLDERSRRAYGRGEIARLVRENQRELRASASRMVEEDTGVEARAELRFEDGETAVLVAPRGRFRVQAAGTLPARARSPAEALGELRRALARRSYAALVRVLTTEAGGAFERDLRSLVKGLESPGTLDIQIDGDTADVEVVGGHWVKLKREDGVWRVKDFD